MQEQTELNMGCKWWGTSLKVIFILLLHVTSDSRGVSISSLECHVLWSIFGEHATVTPKDICMPIKNDKTKS